MPRHSERPVCKTFWTSVVVAVAVLVAVAVETWVIVETSVLSMTWVEVIVLSTVFVWSYLISSLMQNEIVRFNLRCQWFAFEPRPK